MDDGEGEVFKTGVVYLGRIPPHMKAHKLRYILKGYGTVKRMYLRKEPLWKYKKRLDKGGKKGRLFLDGWAEFEKKRDAKFCEAQLNGKTAGLKGRWQDDIWVVKYLHGFKWVHLEQELEKQRREHLDKFKEENEKARETSKKWLKQTKSAVATGKIAKKPDIENDDDDDEEEEEANE